MARPLSVLRLAPLATLLALAGLHSATLAQTAPTAPAATTPGTLQRRLEQLATELANVKAELDAVKQKQAEAAATAPPPAPAPVAAAPVRASAEPTTVLTSYGEINYNRPRSTKDAQADLRRLVFGFQHRFDEKTKLVTEIEVEHAVTSADDAGEVAVEQAYIEHQLSNEWAARAGLFLVPLGLMNENHEPTAYYGVERNFVETRIIPTTWREGGVQFIGNFDNGLTLQTGIATGFNLNKWDATSTEGTEAPLASIHQEMAQANARDLSVFGTLNWRGIPGLLVGGGVFTGGATHDQTSTKARVTLWDLHARWTPGAWDLSALYTRGSITGTAALNQTLVGNTSLIPSGFDGMYAQAAYKLWSSGNRSLAPFFRWERFNSAKNYADLGTGITPSATSAERVYTVGANFNLTPSVVLKADYQKFKSNRNLDRLNLGLGWAF